MRMQIYLEFATQRKTLIVGRCERTKNNSSNMENGEKEKIQKTVRNLPDTIIETSMKFRRKYHDEIILLFYIKLFFQTRHDTKQPEERENRTTKIDDFCIALRKD